MSREEVTGPERLLELEELDRALKAAVASTLSRTSVRRQRPAQPRELRELDAAMKAAVARPPSTASDDPYALAIREQRRRRARAAALGASDLLGEPGWDILLDVYVATRQSSELAVSDAGRMDGVPATTSLRWQNVLVERGMITRIDDPFDGRRVFLAITDLGLERVERALLAGAAA